MKASEVQDIASAVFGQHTEMTHGKRMSELLAKASNDVQTKAAASVKDGHSQSLGAVAFHTLEPFGELMAYLAHALTRAEARIAKLEAAPFVYDGPHETGKTYQRGTFVSHGGSMWHANRETNARPGDSPAWTLAVKHGRDR